MKVTKGFEFEAAHRLSDYEGKCKRVHGHNYKGIVTVEGTPDNRGIVVDFGDLKSLLKKAIVDVFDHRLILKDTKENRQLFGHLSEDWVVWVSYNPTAENMASDFLVRLLKEQSSVIHVEVFETDDSSAIAG